jgi:hypothetical protein
MAETLYSSAYSSCVEKDKIIKYKKKEAGVLKIPASFFYINS